jgi:hypothetical protein
MRTSAAVALLALALIGAGAFADEGFNVPKGPCGSAPPAKPQRRTGGEGVPPLPLPATPLRRTERKRPPAPPTLIAKLQYGELKTIQRDGQEVRYYDWNKDPGDAATLVNLANQTLGLQYTSKVGPMQAFEPDPAQYPIFYFTGSDDFQLSDTEVLRLREFLRSGGTIWGDTCFGDPEFFKAFGREMSRVLPDRQWRPLAPDHPLFNCHYKIEEVTYTRDVPDAPQKKGPPIIFGLDLGDRTAVFLSRYDLSCGWDGHIREGAYSVDPNDARRLGVNMIVYSLATFQLAQYQSAEKVYYEENERARGDFVFAQAKLTDNWDTEANGIANLLKYVTANSSTEVRFQRRAVDLSGDQLQEQPFLYMTGLYDFQLSDVQVQALRRYLTSGGFLLASPTSGRREFDRAFRREIARVLPDHPLEKLPADHPAYTILNRLDRVGYTDYVASLGEEPPALPLEGIQLGGATAVIYSPYGIGGGWRGFDHPFGRDVAWQDAVKLGVNIVLYGMTH